MKKILLTILGAVVIVIVSIASYVKFVLPNVGPAPDLKISATPEDIAHGAYLANHVAACMDCHSTRDWSRFSGPLEAGTLGRGGELFGPGDGFSRKILFQEPYPCQP